MTEILKVHPDYEKWRKSWPGGRHHAPNTNGPIFLKENQLALVDFPFAWPTELGALPDTAPAGSAGILASGLEMGEDAGKDDSASRLRWSLPGAVSKCGLTRGAYPDTEEHSHSFGPSRDSRALELKPMEAGKPWMCGSAQ